LARRRAVVGARIREAREAKGWFQKELAARVHVEPQTVSNWERGQSTPDFDKLELLAQVLERPLTFFLLTGDEDGGQAGLDVPTAEKLLAEIRALRRDLQPLLDVVQELRQARAPATQGERRGQ